MSIPQLNSCCCGCSLKTGTKIIGWLTLILCILMVIMASLGLAALYYLEGHHGNTPSEKEMIEYLPVLKAFTVFFIVVYILGTVLSFLLLLGVYQDKAKLVFIWVVVTTATVLLSFALHIVQAISLPQHTNPLEIIGLLLDVYFILVVYSYYREIRNISSA